MLTEDILYIAFNHASDRCLCFYREKKRTAHFLLLTPFLWYKFTEIPLKWYVFRINYRMARILRLTELNHKICDPIVMRTCQLIALVLFGQKTHLSIHWSELSNLKSLLIGLWIHCCITGPNRSMSNVEDEMLDRNGTFEVSLNCSNIIKYIYFSVGGKKIV